MPGSDLEVLFELFSVSVRGDPFARVGLDEQQEMSNRWFKTVTKNLSPSHLEMVAASTDLRQNAASDVSKLGLLTASNTMERLNDTVRKRSGTMEKIIQMIRNWPSFHGTRKGESRIVQLVRLAGGKKDTVKTHKEADKI